MWRFQVYDHRNGEIYTVTAKDEVEAVMQVAQDEDRSTDYALRWLSATVI